MNMRLNPDDLARVSTDLFELDTDFTLAPARTPFGGGLQAWWQRFVAPQMAPLPQAPPELRLPFADTEATWCPR